MHISPIQFNNSHIARSFKGNSDKAQSSFIQNYQYIPYMTPAKNKPDEYQKGQIVNSKGEIFNRHNTEFCRADMNWKKLEDILRKKYPNPDNVNFIIYAASTGEEPYTIAILLNKIYGKPIPIKAFDISKDVIEENIKKQKEGVFIDIKDVRKIYETLNLGDFNSCFRADRTSGDIKIDRKITDSIEFSQSNIIEDIDLIDSEKPTVLFARNMWPYVHFTQYKGFCKKLNEKLTPNSLFIIGSYDYNGEVGFLNSNDFPRILTKNGFRGISNRFFESFKTLDLIFEKK